jgi:Rrf2 family protein
MNITLSKRGDYVMRSAITLARAEEGALTKIREVVAQTGIPQTFASQVLADLVRARLARSKAGRDGGYWLARPAQEISVLEVIEAAEGPLHAERCALGEGPCRWEAVCPLHETWSQVATALRELLAGVSLAELAERDRALEAGTYQVPADSHRLHPRMLEISDAVQVELGEDAVRSALTRAERATATLVALAAHELTAGQGPAAGNAAPELAGRRAAAEASLVPVSLRPPGNSSPAAPYLLAWRLTGPAGASRLEAGLSVVPVDAERSELRVEGAWFQDPRPGHLLTAPEFDRQARRMLRIFLRRLARFLEQQAADAGPPRSAASA